MAIQEDDLYSLLHVETSPVQTTASWTDHIATVRDISLSRGGYEPFVGISQVEPGSGTITLVDNSATILPGYWVKVRYSSTIIWAGYVQDVSLTYSNVNGTFYEYKTLSVLDWAAYVAQFNVVDLPSAYNNQVYRNADINAQLPDAFVTPTGTGPYLDTYYASLPGTYNVANVLDLVANTTSGGWWRSELVAPTGTSGIDGIVKSGATITAQNVALTDGTHTGSPTNLTYYSDIEVATRTSQVANDVTVNNSDGVTYRSTDSASIAVYGARSAAFDSNRVLWTLGSTFRGATNLITDPSFEISTFEQDTTNFYKSAEQPSQDSGGAWAAFDGTWALRAYNKTGAGTAIDLTENERYPVNAGTTYYVFGYGATTGTTSIRVRTSVSWVNEAGAAISTSYGSFVSCSTAKTWYKASSTVTAPVGAVSARVALYFDRNGSNFPATAKVWADGMYFGTSNETSWWSGNTADTATDIYGWNGTEWASTSYRRTNTLTALATTFLTNNSTARYSPYTIRLNAQANLTASVLFNLYESVYVWFQSHRWTSTVTGIQHNININADGTTRWMVDLIVRPSTYTI